MGDVESVYSTCGKFIPNTTFQILSESDKFYERHGKNILAYFFS